MTVGHGLWNMEKRDRTIGDKGHELSSMDNRDGTTNTCTRVKSEIFVHMHLF